MTTSAGLVLFRVRERALEVLLGHMGGPYWARKDDGAWSIPKGELSERAPSGNPGSSVNGGFAAHGDADSTSTAEAASAARSARR